MRRKAPSRLIAALIATGLWLCASGDACADERTAAVWDRHFAIAAHIDLLPIPLTDVLAVVEIAPIRAVSLEVGAGVSLVQQPLLLAMLHGQIPVGRWALGAEAGMHTGPLHWDPNDVTNGVAWGGGDVGYAYHEHVDAAVFMRAGLSAGFRTSRHLHLRVHGGVTAWLNRRSAYCMGDSGQSFGGCELRGIPPALPYLGTTIGYAFDL